MSMLKVTEETAETSCRDSIWIKKSKQTGSFLVQHRSLMTDSWGLSQSPVYT
uniref:Uncharacterized protein n=1 Tax=Arion vulgaris TaxID=1028688 RepID=A0A0B6ZI32_9EUPU